jgi:hypothetical protein
MFARHPQWKITLCCSLNHSDCDNWQAEPNGETENASPPAINREHAKLWGGTLGMLQHLPRSGLTDIEKSAALELAGSHFLARFNAHGWTSAACLKTIAAKKNWLLTEFIEVAAAQFIDEIAARTNELRRYQARSKQCFVTSHTSPKGDGRGHCIRTTFLGRAD